MNEVKISIQVYCEKCASWAPYENNRYRIFLNNDLFTERNWIWDCNTAIVENMLADLQPGSTNQLRLEPIYQPDTVIRFGLRYLVVNDLHHHVKESATELSFTVN
jgi:hypothetical protein